MTATIPDFPAHGDAALMLIDVQNAFFHPDGESYYPEAPGLLPVLKGLLRGARGHQRLVVHVADVHRAGHPDFETARLPRHGQQGSFDAGFYPGFGPDPEFPGEIVLHKRRFSAFFATDLDLLLREHGIRRLVVAGVKANVCVRATVQDGFGLGYACLVVKDATNSNRPHLAEAALEDMGRYMGWVSDSEHALEVLA